MPRLERYLRANGAAIPRTTLRYAIERFPEREASRAARGDADEDRTTRTSGPAATEVRRHGS